MNELSKLRMVAAGFLIVGLVGVAMTWENFQGGRYQVDLLLVDLWIGWRLMSGDRSVLAWASRASLLMFWLALGVTVLLVLTSLAARYGSVHDASLLHQSLIPLGLVLGLISGVQFLTIRRERRWLPQHKGEQGTVV